MSVHLYAKTGWDSIAVWEKIVPQGQGVRQEKTDFFARERENPPWMVEF